MSGKSGSGGARVRREGKVTGGSHAEPEGSRDHQREPEGTRGNQRACRYKPPRSEFRTTVIFTCTFWTRVPIGGKQPVFGERKLDS